MNLINLNVISPVHLTNRILKDMLARGSGRILYTSSIAATMPGPFQAAYNASKAFVKSFAEAIRDEVKDSGVTVTVLMPGATETNFFHRAGAEDTKLGASEKDDSAEVAREGFEALMNGKDHVLAGSFKNKVQATAAHVLPDTVTAELHRSEPEPGSAQRMASGRRKQVITGDLDWLREPASRRFLDSPIPVSRRHFQLATALCPRTDSV